MWEQKKESKPECVTVCGKKDVNPVVVFIDYYVMAKINIMMKKYPDMEWLAYLIGKDNVVEDFYIPKQQITSSNVTDIEGDPEIQIIGVIHSHHKLGLHSFSGTDHAYINDNHDLSILVWHGGMNGQKRITLPCGATMIVPIELAFFHPELDEAALNKEADDNISEKRYTYIDYTHPYAPGQPYTPSITAAEKKTGRNGRNCGEKHGTNKRDFHYEDYLDQLVYDDGMLSLERCAEDEPDANAVEAHFQRIEERECGISTSKKIPLPNWEV
jgi:hypothetical protein